MEIPEWRVLVYDINRNEVREKNIFMHYEFLKACVKTARKFGDNINTFYEEIRCWLSYYYRSKAEWEILVSGFCSAQDHQSLKADVYSQAMMNKDQFFRYVWDKRNVLSHLNVDRVFEEMRK